MGNAAAPWARPARAGLPPSVSPAAAGLRALLRKLTRVRGAKRLRRQRGTLPGRGPVFAAGLFSRSHEDGTGAQVCGEGRRLAPRPGAGTPGRAISTTLVLGNFWPIGPAPLGPSGWLSPRPKVAWAASPARRCVEVGRRGRGLRSAEPKLCSRCGRGGSRSPSCQARAFERSERKRDERRRWKPAAIPAKGPGGKGAPESETTSTRCSGAAPSARQLRSVSRSGRKKEEVGTRGGPRRGVGSSHSLLPLPPPDIQAVQVVIKRRAQTTASRLSP